MRWYFLVTIPSVFLFACGGSTSDDLFGGAGSGASAGSAGSSGSGAGPSTGGASGAGGGSSGGAGGAAGSAGSGGVAGSGGSAGSAGSGGAGGAPACCMIDQDCPQYFAEPYPAQQCVNGVCKSVPPAGACWSDDDCGGQPGSCIDGFACPCLADCIQADQLGKCKVTTSCCSKDSDCPQSPSSPKVCIGGNCEAVPPKGKCWSDKDCGGGVCAGSCVCPCTDGGNVCVCGGQMGTCEYPPQPGCCQSDGQCGGNALCVSTVCKQPVKDKCWRDDECPAGKTCEGESVCPCLALCAKPDSPGTCQ